MKAEPTVLTTGDEEVDRSPSGDSEAATKARETKPRAEGIFVRAVKGIFSFPAMLGVFLVGWTFSATRIFHVDPDVWWHIKVGQDILRTHHWPTSDTYSFTASGAPWIAYEWLGEVALARVVRLGGNVALLALLTLTAAAAILGLYYYGALRSGNSKAGFVPPALMWSLVLLSFNLRPQMFAYLFLLWVLI